MQDITVDDQEAIYMVNLVKFPPFENGLKQPGTAPIFRKVLGAWVAKNSNPTIAMQNLTSAVEYELPEGNELGRKLLTGDICPAEVRPYGRLTIGKLGSTDDLPLVESFFNDTKACIKHRTSRQLMLVQVRDVALAVAVMMTDQDLKSYGYDRFQKTPRWVYLAGSLGFADDAKREAAFQKWSEWKLAHPAP